MLENFDAITAENFRDCAIHVSRKKDKFSISEMCFTELKFVSDALKKWFSGKYKSQSVSRLKSP